MKYVKLFEELESQEIKTGDYVRLIKTLYTSDIGKIFIVNKLNTFKQKVQYYLDDLDGYDRGWVTEKQIEKLKPHEIDALKYNL